MIVKTKLFTIVMGVSATVVISDAGELVALLTCRVIDAPLQTSSHERPMFWKQTARIPSVCVAEVSDRSQLTYVSQSEDSNLTNQFFSCPVVHIIKRMRKKESNAYCGTLHLHPNPSKSILIPTEFHQRRLFSAAKIATIYNSMCKENSFYDLLLWLFMVVYCCLYNLL